MTTMLNLCGLLGLAATGACTMEQMPQYKYRPAVVPVVVLAQQVNPSTNCNIKGNISQRTGEKIYHVPGQDYYSATRINPRYGERWFCTEAEARKAGWRRSKV